ncbi:MAG: PTS sugar transporter subunit IIA [Planctomycetaceae bacterium]|jgi:PTS system fructose-specific IIA component/PTS system nitrogen regulatory IIA component|nr:PTS sugar transporter subunit IIA [Planctomycetaceae bacterium]
MKFKEFILPDAIRVEIKATDKQGVIREMAESLRDAGGIKKDEFDSIFKAIIKREELGSTGIGRGIAVPHTKHESVEKLVGAVAISRDGVGFDSLDREKVYLFFLIVSPQHQPSEHLRALEHITRQLKDDRFCRFLKDSKTRDEVLALLKEADEDMYGMGK